MMPRPQSPAIARIAAWQHGSVLAAITGAIAALAGLLFDRLEFLRSYLFGYMYWTGIALGCLGILLLHHTVGGKWGMVIRRFCEAGARTLPFMGILLLPILASMPLLYLWTQPAAANDPSIQIKTAYLNVPFFIGRTIFYFAVWTFYAYLLSRKSVEQDRTGDASLIGKMRAISAPGLVVFFFMTSFAFFDWIMSLEPRWFSTVYGAMFLIGQTLSAFAFVIGVLILLSRFEPFSRILTAQHLHDLGNMLLTFTVLWAYLSFSQYLIVWAGNLPDETPWYIRRLDHGWSAIAVFLIVFHFCVPFVLLLQRDVKRRATLLLILCGTMLVIRMVDVYWIVSPSFYGDGLHVRWTDLASLLAVGGIWLSLFFWQLQIRPLVPARDARLAGAPRETVAF